MEHFLDLKSTKHHLFYYILHLILLFYFSLKDTYKLEKILEPARTLIAEVLEITQTDKNDDGVTKEVEKGGKLLRQYVRDTKNNNIGNL